MATAAAVNTAKIKQLEAEAAHYLALADQAKAETKRASIEMAITKISLDEAERDQAYLKTLDHFHQRYVFKGQVDKVSVDKCIAQLDRWQRDSKPPKEIEIVFYSPGGDVVAGLALFDYIQTIRQSGVHVTTSAIGMAASMAGVLLQAGDLRVMGRQSWLLLHEGSFGAVGSVAEVKDTVKWVDLIQKRIRAIFADRSKLSAAQIQRRMARTDWWLDSDEALKLGLVDEVRG